MRPRTLTLPPPCVAVREQLTHADCAIRAVSMATGLPYEDVARHAPARALADGLKVAQLHALGRALGVRLISTPDVDLDDEDTTGLCWVEFPDGKTAHLTYVHRGILCNPADATIWKPSDYVGTYDADWRLYRLVQHGPRGRRHQVR